MAGTDDILLRVGADVSDLKRGLADARKETLDTGKVMEDLKGKLLGVAGVLGLGLGFTKLVGEALEFADSVQKAADQTGMAAEELQFLRYAADQTGSSVDGITSLVGKMQTQLVEAAKGNKEISQAVAELGLDLEELRSLSPDQQFSAIAEAIAQVADPGERAAYAVELFGKSGKEALPLIQTFAEGQEEISANFERMGGPVSADAIKAVDDMGDAAGTAALGIKSAVVELLAMVAPAITAGLQGLTTLIGALRGEAEPAADSLEAMNAKLVKLISTQQKNAVTTNFGMGLSLPTDPRAAAALQKEIDTLKLEIETKKALLALGPIEHAQAAQELADIVVVDEARAAALEKERIYQEQRAIMLDAARRAELDATQTHIDEMVQAYIDASAITTDMEMATLDESALYHAQTWDQKAGNVAESLTAMTAGVARENRAMFEINKAAAMASAVVNTAQGVTKALAAYPPPLSFAMAAAQAVAGAAQIAAISKTKFGSGTAPSQAATPATPVAPVGGGGGGSGGSPTGGVLRLEGAGPDALLTPRMVKTLVERVSEHVRDGGRVEWAS